MGGRGASSGASKSGGTIAALNSGYQNGPPQKDPGTGLQGVYAPGFDNNGNEQLLKWQGQDDDKSARFLAKVHNSVDLNDPQYADGYNYYEGDYQKFSLAMGMNDKPTVLSEAAFDKLVQQNNLQVLYRGEGGQAQADRFMYAENSHTGIGTYGDGFYFSEDKWVANNYARSKGGSAGVVEKMALSPSARIITYNQLMAKMYNSSSDLHAALNKQGKSARAGGAQYLNEGEAQYALKLGYNVVTMGSGYHYACDRSAFIVCKTTKHQY